MPLNSSNMRGILSCLLDLFLSLMHFLIFLLTSFSRSLSSFLIFLLSSKRAMISSSSSSLLQFSLFGDLRTSSLLDFSFAAAVVASFLPLSSSFVCGYSCFIVSFDVLTARWGLVLGLLACCCCGIIFLHHFPFKCTVALFESGSFFIFHFFTRLAFDALRSRVFPPFLNLFLGSFFFGAGITNCAMTHLWPLPM